MTTKATEILDAQLLFAAKRDAANEALDRLDATSKAIRDARKALARAEVMHAAAHAAALAALGEREDAGYALAVAQGRTRVTRVTSR